MIVADVYGKPLDLAVWRRRALSVSRRTRAAGLENSRHWPFGCCTKAIAPEFRTESAWN
jgi:hypothetical protein